MSYEYITDNNLENRQRYQYTKYNGEEFLKEYLESRTLKCGTDKCLLEEAFSQKGNSYICEENADKILKSFEVRKRIYGQYNEKYKPMDDQDYENYQLYLDFAILMVNMYEKTNNLKYLNALLKVNDTLLSIYDMLIEAQRASLGTILLKEMSYVKELRKNVSIDIDENFAEEFINQGNTQFVLDDIAIVCANTTRTKAYLQVLKRSGIKIGKAYIMSLQPQRLQEETDAYDARKEDVLFFDSQEPILYTLKEQEIPFEFINSEDINSDETYECLKSAKETYLIYSGFGGQILKAHLFQMGKKYIHTHAGMVPEFRGSTTVYYHMLVTKNTAASVMFLNEQLDEGDILAQSYFTFSREVQDIDLVYEPYTRAMALKDALLGYAQNGEFSTKNQPKEGNTYYIIHPVLKHIAILALREVQ